MLSSDFSIAFGSNIFTYYIYRRMVCIISFVGIPLPFVVIGLGSVHNEYGVKDIAGKLQ